MLNSKQSRKTERWSGGPTKLRRERKRRSPLAIYCRQPCWSDSEKDWGHHSQQAGSKINKEQCGHTDDRSDIKTFGGWWSQPVKTSTCWKEPSVFWVLFNKAYKVVAGDDTLHNRKGWCMDTAGANMNRFQTVFGDDVLTRIRTCEFHFKESRNKMERKLNDDDEKVMSFVTKC